MESGESTFSVDGITFELARWKELYGGGILTISHIGVFVILSHRGFDGRHSTNNLNMIMFHWGT